MTQIFQSFMTGLQAGQRSADRDRIQRAQDEAGVMVQRGDRRGAALRLMTGGQYGDAATLTNVTNANDRLDADVASGRAAMTGNYKGAADAQYGVGNLEAAERFSGVARNREVGSALTEDPRRAAALAAAGGDVAQATQIIDWADRIDDREREEVMSRHKIMAPILANASSIEDPVQRKAYISSQAQALMGAGYTAEQIANFDATDDNIRAVSDSVLGLEKVLGDYSQRPVGDELRTYRTNPYGVQEVAREEIPMTRAEGMAEKRLGLEERRVELAGQVNSVGDVVGPVLQKQAAGIPLTPGEQQIFDRYITSGQQAGGWGVAPPPPGVGGSGAPPVPQGNGARLPVPPPGTGPAQAGGDGTAQNPARPRSIQEAQALPSGAYFLDPSGNLIRKQ